MYLKTLVIFISAVIFSGCGDTAREFSAVPDLYQEQSLNFDQNSVQKKVDILIVVDNSPSMARDQQNIGVQFNNFISSISQANYRIGFINTDASSPDKLDEEGYHGNLRAVGENGEIYIDSSMSNKAELFLNAITKQGPQKCAANGECNEEPMRAIMRAIDKRKTVNANFFRSDASFVTLILTDEDEGSDGTNALSPLTLFNFMLETFKVSQEAILSFVIAIPPGDTQCLITQRRESASGTGANTGNLVWLLSTLTGGFGVSICDSNFGLQLRKLSRYLEARLLYKSILLDPKPADKKSIEVTIKDVNGNILDIKWKLVNGNVLQFEPAPPQGSSIQVKYIRKKTDEELNSVVILGN